jgi:hypothetical protein
MALDTRLTDMRNAASQTPGEHPACTIVQRKGEYKCGGWQGHQSSADCTSQVFDQYVRQWRRPYIQSLGLTRSHRQLHETEHTATRELSVLFMAVDRVSYGGMSDKRFLYRQPLIFRFGHV